MAGVWYSGKAVVGSVGNMLASSVTHLPVFLRRLVMESMSLSGIVVVEMEVVLWSGGQISRSKLEVNPIF